MNKVISDFFTDSKHLWKIIFGFAVWIVAVVSSFVWPAPGSTSSFSQARQHQLAIVVTAIVVGLTTPFLIRGEKKLKWKWWVVAIAICSISLALFSRYAYLSDSWTCLYDNQRIIVGSDADLTDTAKNFIKSHPDFKTPEQLVMAFPGRVDAVWDQRAVDRHCRVLEFIYVALVPLFAIGLVAVVQLVRCCALK